MIFNKEQIDLMKKIGVNINFEVDELTGNEILEIDEKVSVHLMTHGFTGDNYDPTPDGLICEQIMDILGEIDIAIEGKKPLDQIGKSEKNFHDGCEVQEEGSVKKDNDDLNSDENKQLVLLVKEGFDAELCSISEPRLTVKGESFAFLTENPKQDLGIKEGYLLEIEKLENTTEEEDEHIDEYEEIKVLDYDKDGGPDYYCDLDSFTVIDDYYLYSNDDLLRIIEEYKQNLNNEYLNKLLNTIKGSRVWMIVDPDEKRESFDTYHYVEDEEYGTFLPAFTNAFDIVYKKDDISLKNMIRISFKQLLEIASESDDIDKICIDYTFDEIWISRAYWKLLLNDDEIEIKTGNNKDESIYLDAFQVGDFLESNRGNDVMFYAINEIKFLVRDYIENIDKYKHRRKGEKEYRTFLPAFTSKEFIEKLEKGNDYILVTFKELVDIARSYSTHIDTIIINPCSDYEIQVDEDMWNQVLKVNKQEDIRGRHKDAIKNRRVNGRRKKSPRKKRLCDIKINMRGLKEK